MIATQTAPTQKRVKTNPIRAIEYVRDGYGVGKITVYRNAFHIREYEPTELSYGRLADFANRIIARQVNGYVFELGTPGNDTYFWNIDRRAQ